MKSRKKVYPVWNKILSGSKILNNKEAEELEKVVTELRKNDKSEDHNKNLYK